jgi:uncharacterized protein
MTPAYRLFALLALALPQSTPSGGAIARFVPPVPTPASFISDERRLLSDSAKRALDARITAMQRDKLGDVGVAIIPSIGDYSASQVGVEIYRTWKIGSQAEIGSEERNLGVLLLIVPKELSPNNRGECWITTGMGSEAFITDAMAGSFCRNGIIPFLQERDYAGAVSSALVLIENRMRTAKGIGLAPGAAAQAPQPRGARDALATTMATSARTFAWILGSVAGVLTLILGIVGYTRWKRNHPRTCPKCKRTMERLSEHADNAKLEAGQVVEEKLGSVDYDVWSCRCGHDIVIPYRKLFSRHMECRKCKRRTASKQYRIMRPATRSSTGTAEHRYTCQACGEKWTEMVVLPVLADTSSSGGAGGGGGGGGGGSSFGGSGSTSGGGGGSSY